MKFLWGFVLGSVFFAAAVAQAADVVIYDAALYPASPIGNKGLRVLVNGDRVGGWVNRRFITQQAKDASENLMLTRDFFATRFGRDSYDNRGSTIDAVVRASAWPVDVTGMKQNAAWVSNLRLFVFGFGEGEGLKWFTQALDVIAHEFTHAVIDSTCQLEYKGQSGALNEHLADFFGEAIEIASGRTNQPFLVGEKILSQELKDRVHAQKGRVVEALRDMRNPQNGLSPQPATMAEIPEKFGPACSPTSENDRCGVHDLSGIPNRATVLIMDQLGFEPTLRIVYQTLVTRLRPTSGFSEYRRELKAECQAEGLSNCEAIDAAFNEVGVP